MPRGWYDCQPTLSSYPERSRANSPQRRRRERRTRIATLTEQGGDIMKRRHVTPWLAVLFSVVLIVGSASADFSGTVSGYLLTCVNDDLNHPSSGLPLEGVPVKIYHKTHPTQVDPPFVATAWTNSSGFWSVNFSSLECSSFPNFNELVVAVIPLSELRNWPCPAVQQLPIPCDESSIWFSEIYYRCGGRNTPPCPIADSPLGR